MSKSKPSKEEIEVAYNSQFYTTSKGKPISLDTKQKKLVDIATYKLFAQQSASSVTKSFAKKAVDHNEAYIILKPKERRVLDDLVSQMSLKTLNHKNQLDQAIIDAKEKQKQKTFVNRLKNGLKSLASKFSYTNLRSASRSTSISSGRSSSGESR